MLKSKKGFTLVELLIVIVVIGVLSSMMMLSSTEAVSSAKVARIISDLTNWKKAALAWYVDNIDKVDSKGNIKKADGTYGYFGNNGTVTMAEIAKYFSKSFETTSGTYSSINPSAVKDSASGGKYFTDYRRDSNNNPSGRWFIIFEMPTSWEKDKRLKDKLEARASSLGLLMVRANASEVYSYSAEHEWSKYVAIEVMNFAN